MKTRLLSTLAFIGLMTAVPALAEDDVVVARVNGGEIKKSDITREMTALPPQLQQIPLEQIYPQLLERMVDARLLMDEAKKDKIDQSDEYKSRLSHAQDRIMADLELRAKVKPQVTDAMVKERYNTAISKAPQQDEVKASHILVKTEKEAQDIIAQLGKGGDFAKIAAEKSDDKGSAEKGGELGYFTQGAMVPAFAKAAFGMKPGEISKTPVKTEFGYHIIKVEDRRKAPPIPLEKVRPQIEAQLGNELADKYLDGLRKGAKIELFDLTGKPMETPKAPAAAEPAKK